MPTIRHANSVFEDHAVYVSGSSFESCTFRRCTLIIKELSSVGEFDSCKFEGCVWYLNAMVSNRDSWEEFEQRVAPTLRDSLPIPETDAAG